MFMRTLAIPFLAICAAVFAASASFGAEASPVKMWEARITLPTYLAGDPEPNPMFFFGRQSQGAQGPVYPYPMYDTLTGKKVDKSYTILYLENEYLRIGVLPEIGGRLFEGIDKTNDYHFIYRQRVIKPALIGLIGAWISGGVEWNIPHHHRASTFLPVQYSLEEAPDGAKTIWVGELELRDRMRWAVGYTLRPGKSYLETSLRIVNRTPEAKTMLCFANAAVHANDQYQVIFPPSTQFGVHHAKREFTTWPISTSAYGGADFSRGVAISWYKNHPSPNSVFAWNYQDDFFAGYDHGKQAGTMTIADHNIVPGKKFWTWGNGPSGKRWDAILTDEDGPYIELMVGAYSDNQPDYSWLQPFETRAFTINWYPFREIGGVKKANLQAAVNLDVKPGSATVGFHTTQAYPSARALLKSGSQVLLDESIAISPAKPYVRQVALPAGIDENTLVASLSVADNELVAYTPIRLARQPTPPVVKAPPSPGSIKTIEELYLTGLRAQQFHSPTVEPLNYWREALRRDPSDSRTNTALGITAYSEARYDEAEAHLRKAVERVTANYTSPKHAEAIYYLGATLQAAGKIDEADVWLNQATWSFAWKPAACFALAQIAVSRGQFQAALDLVSQSISGNALHLRAQNLKAAILRHMGRKQEALQVLAAAHSADPLDVRTLAERYLLDRSGEAAAALVHAMNRHPSTAQETAAEYLNEGLWGDGSEVLLKMLEAAPDSARIHPMPLYYLGYFAGKLGQRDKASEYYRKAMSMPTEYVFPFQAEAIPVLRQAIGANPLDPRAPFYLGNLLYDWQPAPAIQLWESAVAIDPSFAIAHRNLAVAYMHLPDGAGLNKAIASMERAVSAPNRYALHFTELDALYEQAGVPIEKRLQLFEQNMNIVARRDDAVNRAIALHVASGQFDRAIQTMSTRTFAVAEGANLNVVDHWTNALVLRARQRIHAKRYREALEDLKLAATIPENLPVMSIETGTRAAEIAWWTGIALEAEGNSNQALEAFQQAASATAAIPRRRPTQQEQSAPSHSDQEYYQGLALQKLGRTQEAEQRFEALLRFSRNVLRQVTTGTLRAGDASPRARTAHAHYLAGLGHLGLNQTTQATEQFSKAVASSPDHVAARMALSPGLEISKR